MKVFIALCIFFVVLQVGVAVPAALEVEEDHLVENEAKNAALEKVAEEIASSFVKEAEADAENARILVPENLPESDVAEEQQRQDCGTGPIPFCHPQLPFGGK